MHWEYPRLTIHHENAREQKRAAVTVIRFLQALNQVATQLLLSLDSLEQRLEVASTEAGEVVALDDLNEDGWTIHHVLQSLVLHVTSSGESTYLGEQLQEITTLVEVDQDIETLDRLEVLVQH